MINPKNVDIIILDFDKNLSINPLPRIKAKAISWALRIGINAGIKTKKELLSSDRYKVFKELKNGRLNLSMPGNKKILAKESFNNNFLDENVVLDLTYPSHLAIQYGANN
jgi:hypothetical protein